jgi:hypothetical protein
MRVRIALLFLLICAGAARAQMLHPGYGTLGAPMSNFISTSYLSKQVMNDVVFSSSKRPNNNANAVKAVRVARAAPVAPRKLATAYPEDARAEAEKVFASLLELYPKVEKQYGLPPNDLGGVVGLFLTASYEAYHKTSLDEPKVKAVLAQMRAALGANPAIAQAPNAEKQELYEQLAILGMLAASTNLALQTNPQVANARKIEANLRQAGKSYLEHFLKTDADKVQITGAGLVVSGASANQNDARPSTVPSADASVQRDEDGDEGDDDDSAEEDTPPPAGKPRGSAPNGENVAAIAPARFATAPNAGLKPAQVVGLAQQIQYEGMKLDVMTGTYSGTHQVDDYLLLADGSIRKGWPKDVPLEDFDAAASMQTEPKLWGKYKARVKPGESGFYDAVWADGEQEKLSLSFVVLARSDERLNGFFYRAGTASSDVAGGSRTFASGWAGILFKQDGRFETSQGGSASYDSDANGSGSGDDFSAVATNKQSAQGRYRLAGSALELRFDDGQVERRQFAFSSKGKNWIYVNGTRLLLKK